MEFVTQRIQLECLQNRIETSLGCLVFIDSTKKSLLLRIVDWQDRCVRGRRTSRVLGGGWGVWSEERFVVAAAGSTRVPGGTCKSGLETAAAGRRPRRAGRHSRLTPSGQPRHHSLCRAAPTSHHLSRLRLRGAHPLPYPYRLPSRDHRE